MAPYTACSVHLTRFPPALDRAVALTARRSTSHGGRFRSIKSAWTHAAPDDGDAVRTDSGRDGRAHFRKAEAFKAPVDGDDSLAPIVYQQPCRKGRVGVYEEYVSLACKNEMLAGLLKDFSSPTS